MAEFLDLPNEIQNEILRIYPETLINSITLAKKFPKQLLKLLCNLRITSNEFIKYIKTDPRTFMTFRPPDSELFEFNSPEEDFKYDTWVDIYTLTAPENWTMLYLIITSELNEVCINPDSHDKSNSTFLERIINHYDPQTPMYLDLLSTYRIVNKRTQCNAKDFVKRQFNEIVENHKILILQNPIYSFDLYLYLIAHTWIFNIDSPLLLLSKETIIKTDKYRQPLSDIKELDEIKSAITRLIQEINKRLDIIELLA